MNNKNKQIGLAVIIVAIIAVVTLSVTFISPKKISGRYEISSFIFDGTDLVEYARGSYIEVNGIDNTSKSEIWLKFDDLSSLCEGFIDTVSETDNNITYKFTITTCVGDFISNSSTYYWLYYNKKGDYITIQVDFGEIRFSK